MTIKSVVAAFTFTGIVSQITETPPGLLTYGPLGIITGWLMYRDEKRATQLRKHEELESEHRIDILHRMDGLTKAILVDVLERNSSQQSKAIAREAIAKIDARTAKKEREG